MEQIIQTKLSDNEEKTVNSSVEGSADTTSRGTRKFLFIGEDDDVRYELKLRSILFTTICLNLKNILKNIQSVLASNFPWGVLDKIMFFGFIFWAYD